MTGARPARRGRAAASRPGARAATAAAGPWQAVGWDPEYVVEIAISPQLREHDPGRPLSLEEALAASRGPAAKQPSSDPEPEPEP